MHTIDLNRFDKSEESLFSFDKQTRKPLLVKKVAFIGLSIALHFTVVAMFVIYGPTAIQPIQDEPTPLKSYLVVKPLRNTLPTKVTEPELTELEIENAGAESAEAQVIVPDNNEQALKAPQIKGADANASLKEKPKQDIMQSEKSELPAQSAQVDKAQTQSSLTETENSAMLNKPMDVNKAIGNYQKQIHNAKVQRMAEQAAKAYRKAKTSPEIDPTVTFSYEERSAALRKIEVDCANILKKGMRILSYFGGGTIDCRNNSNFQQYINKHLNKVPLEDEQ